MSKNDAIEVWAFVKLVGIFLDGLINNTYTREMTYELAKSLKEDQPKILVKAKRVAGETIK